MSQTILFSDVKNQIKDLVANYNVTNVDSSSVNRAANRAIEIVQRRLSLPSDEKIQSFYFYEDTKFYNCNDGFNELLGLRYNTSGATTIIGQDPNVPRRRWNIYKDVDILQTTGVWPDENQVGFTTLNGQNQLVLHGRNINGSYTVNALNNTSGLTFSTDIANATQDANIFKYSGGSVKFKINTGLSASFVHFSGLWNIFNLFNQNGAYRLYVDFPTGTTGYFTNVELRLQSSTGNYYSITTTTQSDGTAWTSGTGNWSLLSWLLSAATQTGTPDASNIKDVYIYFNHSGSFATTTDLRINYFYQITPDYMDAIYYSAFKGTDTTGVTPKIVLDVDSDICYFGSYAPDLIWPIALQGAKILSPQLLADPGFRAIYKEDFEEAIRLFGRTYPRKRGTGQFGQTDLRR